MYSVCDSYRDAEGWHNDELFKSASMVCIVYFLRDVFCSFKGEELIEGDNATYNRIKVKQDVEGTIIKYKEKYLGTDKLQVEGS